MGIYSLEIAIARIATANFKYMYKWLSDASKIPIGCQQPFHFSDCFAGVTITGTAWARTGQGQAGQFGYSPFRLGVFHGKSLLNFAMEHQNL